MNDYMYCIPQSSSFVHILSWSTVSRMQSREFQCSAPPLGSIHRRNLCPAKKSLLEPEKPQWNLHFAVANHSDFSGSFVSQSTLYTNLKFQKKPGVGTHLNANSANMQTDTKTNSINHSNFMVELWFTQMQNVQKQSSISCSILSSLGYFIKFKKMCQLQAFNIV